MQISEFGSQDFVGMSVIITKLFGQLIEKFVMLVIVSTIPTGVIGILFKDTVELAGTMLIVPGICLLITSVFLVIADYADEGTKRPREASYVNAGLIGVAQGIATMPGLSRSGTTITACLLCGFEKKFAVKYSFIMSIPAVLGAVVLELKDVAKAPLQASAVPACAVATVISAIVGYLSICIIMRLIQGKKYKIFAVYCAIVGLITVGYGIFDNWRSVMAAKTSAGKEKGRQRRAKCQKNDKRSKGST